jgi:two-component system CheB/CheR fusion protein
MNEELQSTNEEIQTVNAELRQRTDELNHTNAFLQSVVGSLTSGAVVLNQNLNILMWNYKAEDLWGLREDEVKGQSLLNLEIGLPVDQLRSIIRPCLSGDADRKEILLDATNRRGKAFMCRVSCSPLMSHDKERQGVIVLMEEERKSD